MGRRQKDSLIILAFIAFISLGLPDGLLGVAWPSIRSDFGLRIDELGYLLFASTAGYILSSFFSGALIRLMGVGSLLSASCLATGIALLSYTLSPVWALIPLAGFLSGLGAGAIDAGLNTYIENRYPEQVMQWLHASFGVGITSGPLIMTAGLTFLSSWRFGYLAVGSFQLLLALGFLLSRRIWEKRDSQPENSREDLKTSVAVRSMRETLSEPGALLSILLFFTYTGIELTLGHWSYTLLTEARDLPVTIAGLVTGSFWGFFTLGRILAGLYSKRLGAVRVLMFSTGGALSGALLLLVSRDPVVSTVAIVLCGLSVAPIFPALVSTTSKRVENSHVNNTIGMQIAAAGIGAAALPTVTGVVARNYGIESIASSILVLVLLFLLVNLLSMRRDRPNTAS